MLSTRPTSWVNERSTSFDVYGYATLKCVFDISQLQVAQNDFRSTTRVPSTTWRHVTSSARSSRSSSHWRASRRRPETQFRFGRPTCRTRSCGVTGSTTTSSCMTRRPQSTPSTTRGSTEPLLTILQGKTKHSNLSKLRLFYPQWDQIWRYFIALDDKSSQNNCDFWGTFKNITLA